MKHLLLLLCLLCAVGAHAQASPNASASSCRYCALPVNDQLFTETGRLELDYRQSVPGAVADAEMAKNIPTSRNVIDVLNHLSRHGWELLATTTVQIREEGDASSRFFTNETRYLFRRRTP